jgi:hypothetical protein
MAVPTSITDLSTTASSNSPAGTEAVLPNLDNYLRAHAAFIAQTYADALSKASGGTVAGATTFSTLATFSNGIAVTGTASVSGAVSFANTLGVTGTTTLGTLSATTVTFSGTMAVTGAITATGGVVGNVTGNATTATTATTLQTARTIALSGGATGTATSFNGSANITIPVTSLDATLLSGAVPAASLGNASQFTTSTDSSLTDYPVGSLVMVYTSGAGSIPHRNASATVYIDAGNPERFLLVSSGSALTGTWRSRGAVVSTGSEIDVLMQRVA